MQGHHIYKHVWTPFVGEELTCTHEIENTKDPFAVVLVRRSTVVRHVPRKISATCALFLARKELFNVKSLVRHPFLYVLPGMCIHIVKYFKFGDSEANLPNCQIAKLKASLKFPVIW